MSTGSGKDAYARYKEAIRALKCRLSDVVYRARLADTEPTATTINPEILV
jgi:hypothetical protein